MSGPRNIQAATKAAREREVIRKTLLAWAREHPLSGPLTARDLRRMTGIQLGERRFQQHVKSLRIEAALRELIAEYFANATPKEPSPAADTENTPAGDPSCP